jgi:hypothetical protein
MPRRDWDDDDDRPPRRRPRDNGDSPTSRGGGSALLITIAIAGSGLVLLAVVGTLAYFLGFAPARIATGPVTGAPEEEAKDRLVRVRVSDSPQQILFGGTEDGHAAVVSFDTDGVGDVVEVFNTATGEPRGKLRSKLATIAGFALTPDGAWLARVELTPFEGNPVSVWSVADGTQIVRFTPYPRKPEAPGQVPDLTWIGFLPGNKLITVNARGGFDVWSVPAMQKLHGKAGGLEPGQSLQRNVTHMPTNFALTPDGKTLALFDGRGFTLYDPATGAQTGRTDPFVANREEFKCWGTALRADGSRLACVYSADGGLGADTKLTVWDVRTGKSVADSVIRPPGMQPPGCSWWGPGHVLLWKRELDYADVIDAATGERTGVVNVHGKLGPTGPGDYLWAVTEGAFVRSPAGAIRPGMGFMVTPNGVLRQ